MNNMMNEQATPIGPTIDDVIDDLARAEATEAYRHASVARIRSAIQLGAISAYTATLGTITGEAAEQLAPRLVKGTAVYPEGRLRLEQWQTREGEQRSTLKLSAWTCQPMGQIGRQRPRQDDQPSRPRAMPQAVAVGTGRNTRQQLGLDDEPEGWPELWGQARA